MSCLNESDLLEICALAAKSGRPLSDVIIDWLHTNGWHGLAVRCADALTGRGAQDRGAESKDGAAN